MKIQMFFDQGSVLKPEDTLIYRPPFFYGVIDGYSGVNKEVGKNSNITLGQKVIGLISRVFAEASGEESLETLLLMANAAIRQMVEAIGLSPDDANGPGVSFALAKITNHKMEIIQAGDCLCAWINSDGTIGATPNRVLPFTVEYHQEVERLKEKYRGDKAKAWAESRDYLARINRKRINKRNGWATLNGQTTALKFAERVSLDRNNLAWLMFFSDGFVPLLETAYEKKLARRLFSLYRRKSLAEILAVNRKVEGGKFDPSFHPEATAMMMEFYAIHNPLL